MPLECCLSLGKELKHSLFEININLYDFDLFLVESNRHGFNLRASKF